MKRWSTVCAVAATALVVAGCSSSSSSSSSNSGGSGGGAATRSIKVDNTTPAFTGGFLAYFPNQVTVHAGDTVDFAEQFSGEPHSVTLGTLVDKAIAAWDKLTPDQQQNGAPPPEVATLPVMLPQGPGDADQRAVNPCFVAAGASLPTAATAKCPNQTQGDFTGQDAWYNSGFLAKGTHFTVKLASTIAPGTYHYYCNLHGPDMSGTITVVPASTPIPSQADVDAAGASKLAGIVSQLTPAVANATAGKFGLPGLGPNVAGYGAPTVQNAQIEQFFPATINAKVGTKVTWQVLGVHTITFAPPSPAPYALAQAPDGSYHNNEAAGAPVPLPAGPPPPTTPAQANQPSSVDGGTWNGTGERSSGALLSFPPAIVSYSLTFTKAGTYTYVCLIHPGMTGQVVVK